MAVPDFQTLTLPFLQLADDEKEHSIASTAKKLADYLNLTEEDVSEMLPSGRQSRYRNRVNWVVAADSSVE